MNARVTRVRQREQPAFRALLSEHGQALTSLWSALDGHPLTSDALVDHVATLWQALALAQPLDNERAWALSEAVCTDAARAPLLRLDQRIEADRVLQLVLRDAAGVATRLDRAQLETIRHHSPHLAPAVDHVAAIIHDALSAPTGPGPLDTLWPSIAAKLS